MNSNMDSAFDPNGMTQALEWALESSSDPAIATADWLAHDLAPQYDTAVQLIADPDVPLEVLRQAKDVFKALRMTGETVDDRQMGSRMYLAIVAAAFVYHDTRISRQSEAALDRNLERSIDDKRLPKVMRLLAGRALAIVRGGTASDFDCERLNVLELEDDD